MIELFKGKCLYGLTVLTVTGILMSCEENNDSNVKNPDVPTVSAGAYILNQGEYSSKIEGSLNVLDYASQSMREKVFATVNNRSLGSTPQCGVAYGSKIYIGVYESKSIEVIDKYTFKSIKQIKLEDSKQGQSPRGMVAKGGYVYVTMNEGYLARLDTIGLVIDKQVKVGLNPEQPAIMGDYVYVPNSAWTAGYSDMASAVSLSTFTEVREFKVPLNPNKFLTNGNELFVISWGNYSDQPAVMAKVNSNNGDYEVIGNARMGAIKGNTIFLIDNPYGMKTTYWKYDISTGKKTEMEFPEIVAPAGIGVDPFRDVLLIASVPMDNGYPSYLLPGYVCEYTTEGKFLKKYNTGVGEAAIFFNVE